MLPPDDAPRVQLVGAGPGPIDLLTFRAERAIRQAQAVLYDALVEPEVLSHAPEACLKIMAGKRSGGASMAQATINALMVKLARRGLRVVRLEGGDPSIFGRVGEEIAYLQAHGVEVEVVPGVTAASAAAAQFAFPLTHRGEARRLVFATARTQDGRLVAEGWPSLADAEATLALYMARDAIAEVVARLAGEGRSLATPAIAVENAGRVNARLVRGRLHDIAERLVRAQCDGPVVLIVGPVAALARDAGEQRPCADAGDLAPLGSAPAPRWSRA